MIDLAALASHRAQGPESEAISPDFPPDPAAARARLLAVRPAEYAARRNFVDGPVTRLSPWITHGMLTVPGIIAELRQRHRLPNSHRLVFELAWREYFRHVWRHLGDGILADVGPGLRGVHYRREMPADVLEARSGVPVVDASVRELYASGWLHNHQRMWLAAYLVHYRKVDWRTAADWMYGHLLDGDLASNHLSWQWVAATFGAKPYLFNAENVARYAPALASPGTVLDRGYAALEELARSPADAGPEAGAPAAGATPPPLLPLPPELHPDAPPPVLPRSARIAWVHPWSLGERPRAEMVVGVLHLPFHRRFPWSEKRWRFVMERMRSISDFVWAGDLRRLGRELPGRPQALDTLNPGYREALGYTRVSPEPRYFPDPPRLCRSFSRFWKTVQGAR